MRSKEAQLAEDLANLKEIKRASSFKRPARLSAAPGKKMPERKIGLAVDEGEETPKEQERKIEE